MTDEYSIVIILLYPFTILIEYDQEFILKQIILLYL